MPCLKTQMPKFKIETPESCNSVATRLPCANIASGSFSLSHFLLSPLKTKRGKRAMFSSSSHFEDEPLLKLSQLPPYTHRSQLERSRTSRHMVYTGCLCTFFRPLCTLHLIVYGVTPPRTPRISRPKSQVLKPTFLSLN